MTDKDRSAFIPPCIPTLVDKPPEGDRWSHEIKYDGYRTQIHLIGRNAYGYTRNGHDWSNKYGSVLVAARETIRCDAILDGEMVVQDEIGRSDFKKLATAIRWENASLLFYAFDLLWVDGNDLRKVRCEERRFRLEILLGPPRPDTPIQFSQSFEGSGAEFFGAVERMGLEGIVSKRRASIYRSGPSKDWLKTKAYMTGEFVVIGYERKRGEAPSLLLAEGTDSKLRYVGRAIPAIPQAQRDELWKALEFLHTSHFATPIGAGNKAAVPVQPVLKVMAKHLRGEEKLRHATVVDILTP
ncbi:ATP-dependent DNA ligase [Aminobacter aminovorans]|jgi:bifunctional non-homologous end joining protein LigD|uniref:ATP-dependent DNA ligase n=1 Tax=Aminobacter aminovorans TaxID=83263 RepID=A0AAC8YVQ3_AMIAI|nr:RNA ligase family protein [Aminobacter aminovorans]AMS45159.1 ATP-dependent DNA ligase [Aminobacter aminovorans]MBB3705085.1 DNA ligase D-like protein (predicted ligase) [Aminobacter aminovorans]